MRARGVTSLAAAFLIVSGAVVAHASSFSGTSSGVTSIHVERDRLELTGLPDAYPACLDDGRCAPAADDAGLDEPEPFDEVVPETEPDLEPDLDPDLEPDLDPEVDPEVDPVPSATDGGATTDVQDDR